MQLTRRMRQAPSRPDAVEPTSGDEPKRTQRLHHGFASRWASFERYVLLAATAFFIYILLQNYLDYGTTLQDWDWLFISGFLVFIVAVQLARGLPYKFNVLLFRLADRGVLVESHDQGIKLDRDAEQLRALHDRVRELEHWLAQIVGILVALILLVACIAAFGQFGPGVVLQHFGLILVATAAGYVAGRHIGTMIAYSFLGAYMRSARVAVQAKPGHIDGAAGLKPIGSFFFAQAMLLAIPAVFLGAWWFLFPLWPVQYGYWRDPYLAMLVVVVAFEMAAFVAPMWRFHIIMQDQKDALTARADELSPLMESLKAAQADAETEQESSQLKQRLAAVQREYWDIETMPTWPVDLATWRRFARNNAVLVLPLVTKLMGADTVVGRILAALDDVLKKQNG
jgi:hypothetical protein